jgi:TFIIF-interacting CTD phosphatase-like protein
MNYNGKNQDIYVKFRPYLKQFLDEMIQYFEIIIYSAGNREVFKLLVIFSIAKK